MLLDRMVNLLSRGCVVPVLQYIKHCWQRGDTDISLIRYFITEVWNIIIIIISINFYYIILDIVICHLSQISVFLKIWFEKNISLTTTPN